MTQENPGEQTKREKRTTLELKISQTISESLTEIQEEKSKPHEALSKVFDFLKQSREVAGHIFAAFYRLDLYQELLSNSLPKGVVELSGRQVVKDTVFMLRWFRELLNPEKYLQVMDEFWPRNSNKMVVNPSVESKYQLLQNVEDWVINSEAGSHVARYELLEQPTVLDAIAGIILEQYHSDTKKRVASSGQGKTHSGLPVMEDFEVIIHVGDRQFIKKAIRTDILEARDKESLKAIIFSELSHNQHWQTLPTDLSKAKSRAFAGGAVQMWRKNIHKKDNFECADLGIVLADPQEMTLNHVQQDQRNYTYGTGIPTVWRLAVTPEHTVSKVATKNSHAFADGKYARDEAVGILNSLPVASPTNPDEVIPKVGGSVGINQGQSIDNVTEVWLDRQDAVVNELFAFFKKNEPPVTITFSALLHFALMITLQREHMHYLEACDKDGTVAPAISIFPERLMVALQENDAYLNENMMSLLFACFGILKHESSEVRLGYGTVKAMAVMTFGWVRTFLNKVAQNLDPDRTNMLTKTSLSSMLVRRSDQQPTHVIGKVRMTGFTTAVALPYQHGEAVGACDVDSDQVLVTLRHGIAKELQLGESEKFMSTLSKNYQLILSVLSQYMNYMQRASQILSKD